MSPDHDAPSRRNLLRAVAALPFLVLTGHVDAQGPATPPSLAGTTLRILMPQRPNAAYTDAVRNVATSWGSGEGVTVLVDTIPEQDLAATIEREIKEGTGHDLIATDMPLLHHADGMHDLAQLHDGLAGRFGPPAEPCDLATRLPDDRRPALSLAYAPAPLIYRRSIWEKYGLPDGPSDWQQLHETGSQIWHEEGMNVGFGLSRDRGSERQAAMLLAAFGGSMFDTAGEMVLDSPATVEAVRFCASLYRDAMSPESLSWSSDRPAQLLADGITSVIFDDISALRHAQSRNQDVANVLAIAAPLIGPESGQFGTAPATSYRAFHIPLFAANPDAARACLISLVESSAQLIGAGQLADRPAYGLLVPELVEDGGWLDVDPYGAMPPEKLAMLKTSAVWTTYPGAPGPAQSLATRAHDRFLLARMMARVAMGTHAPEEAVFDAGVELATLAGED